MNLIDKFLQIIKEKPIVLYVLLGAVIVIFLILDKTSSSQVNAKQSPQSIGKRKNEYPLTSKEVDQKVYLSRLAKSYFEAEDRMRLMQKTIDELKNSSANMERTIKKISDKKSRNESESGVSDILNIDQVDDELKVVGFNPPQEDESVYLPLGSFCRGTLLTGVYASSDQNNPLPVLIRLDEAFYGPNQARIPLKGSFALGKAYGDLVSERALIQIIAISSVFEDGQVFESQQNLGYITDRQGELGVRGRVIYNTGKQLALGFMAGFTSGGAQALADSQTTTRTTENGSVIKEVAGNTASQAVFSGLAKSASTLSDYYGQQAENLIPAIHVSNGQEVYFIVQQGVKINGLRKDRINDLI